MLTPNVEVMLNWQSFHVSDGLLLGYTHKRYVSRGSIRMFRLCGVKRRLEYSGVDWTGIYFRFIQGGMSGALLYFHGF
jgi:hypothetical protein